MITDSEARGAYDELLAKIGAIEASNLRTEIETAVAQGHLQKVKQHSTQASLPPKAALALALRMLAAWVEHVFLVTEAERTLSDVSGTAVRGIRWAADRQDIVEQARGTAFEERAALTTSSLPARGEEPLSSLHRSLQRIHALASEVAMEPE
jgi:hypothetical protein